MGAEGIVLIGADCDGPAAEAAAVSVPAVRDTAENGLPLQMQDRVWMQIAPRPDFVARAACRVWH